MATKVYDTNEELLRDVLNCFLEEDIDLIVRAWDYARHHYATLQHRTGEPFLQYVLRVAKILVDLGSSPIVIAAAIVFPPLPCYKAAFSDLKNIFSDQQELLRLVEELFNLSHFEWDVWPNNSDDRDSELRKEVMLKMFLLAIGELKEDDSARTLLNVVHFQKREKQVENIIRMMLASVTDIRALIIKLADRLYFMKSLKYLSDEDKRAIHSTRLAHISLAIYAPLADRLGLWQLKSELEDMSFRLLDFDAYKAIARQLAVKKEQRDQAVDDIIPLIKDALRVYGVQAEVTGRAKHIYGIHKKMEAKQLTLEQVNDLLGIRIIVSMPEDHNEDQNLSSEAGNAKRQAQKAKRQVQRAIQQKAIQECYYIQDIILEKWPPIKSFYDGQVGRDWIAHPKENGYQSLHTTVEIEKKIVEIQIRTQQMHETAEFGAAAEHWRYKDPKIYRKGKIPRVTKEKDVMWGKQLVELRKSMTNQQEASDLKQKNLLKDRIYAITPQGHVLDFPKGSTPLDFAYRIHTELGHRYTGAKIAGHMVSLDYQLKNGEIVELITSRARKGPNPEWLSISKDKDGRKRYIFARTRQARSKIINWLNKHDEEYKSRHEEQIKLKTLK